MKYEVSFSLITAGGDVKKAREFRAGEIVTESDITAAGVDFDHALANGALTPLKGTEDDSSDPTPRT
jgi:hypothetical protein